MFKLNFRKDHCLFLNTSLVLCIGDMIRNGDYFNTFDQFVSQVIKTNIKASFGLFGLLSILLQRAKYIYNNYKYPITIQSVCKLYKGWKIYMMHFVYKNDIHIHLNKNGI